MYLWPEYGSGLFVRRTCICSLSSRRSRNVLMQFMDSEYNLSVAIRRNLSASYLPNRLLWHPQVMLHNWLPKVVS